MTSLHRSHAFLAFMGYLAFVVYGSLLPFELRDRSLTEALQAFAGIRLPESRRRFTRGLDRQYRPVYPPGIPGMYLGRRHTPP